MPIIDFTNGSVPIPCRVFDAHRNEHKLVARCDTRTGEIEKHVPDPNHPDRLVLEGDHALVEHVQAPAPLTIEEW